MQFDSSELKAHGALVLVALIYGANYIIAKDVMDQRYLEPIAFVMLRAISGVFLFIVFHRIFVKEHIRRKDIKRIALCGLFGVAINQGFFFSGLERTTPIHASLLMTMTPILVLVVSHFILKERITARKIAGIMTGLSGAVILLTAGEEITFDPAYLTGDIMILTNALSFGVYLVLVKQLLARYHPLTVIKWVFVFGMIYLLPFGGVPLVATDWSIFTPGVWLAVLYVLIGVTFLAYLLNIYAIKTVSPNVVSMYIYLQPLLASVLSLILGREEFSIVKGVAAVCIFTGVYLVSRTRKGVATTG